MKKTKLRKESSARNSATRKVAHKTVFSRHPVHFHVDALRETIHTALTTAGITGLSLRSLQFATSGNCPPGQHLEKECTRDKDGKETCTWVCKPN
jgi:hypothetical protein